LEKGEIKKEAPTSQYLSPSHLNK